MNRPASLAIFWISLLGLYLELLLIRWIGTEIRIFAYLQNTVLVVCFLGLGIGLFTSQRRASPARGLLSLLILAGALAIPASREVLTGTSSLLTVLGEINIWEMGGTTTGLVAALSLAIGLVLAFLLMILVLEPFIPIGRVLGRLIDEHPRPVVAYSVNVAGSLAGIWLFVALSRFSLSPATWFLVLALLAVPAIRGGGKQRWAVALALASLPVLVALSVRPEGTIRTVWSPYQKLELVGVPQPAPKQIPTARYEVYVNTSGHQLILDLSSSGLGARSKGPQEGVSLSTYDVPALIHPNPERVLVVGAGTGNDVAGMLRNGVRDVTAVDIDPVILDFGREYHPEQPYSSPSVRTINTDARSFFATTQERFDVIAFGFLDSHTSTSLTNARLDHYVYTIESFSHVRDLLRDGGIVTVAFFPLRPFIADRIAGQLADVFGERPLAFDFPFDAHGSAGILFVAGDLDAAGKQMARVRELERLTELAETRPVSLPYTTAPATDDWPYLYLDQPRIPALFLLLGGLLGLLVLYGMREHGLPRSMNPLAWNREPWHFFFLGAAFLLLEVQNISKASVVLGNTWLVNAVIISGVLTMVLVANMIVLRGPQVPLLPLFAILVAVTLGLYATDLARFAFLPFMQKAIIVGLLTTLPMLFSGIAFASAFSVSTARDAALGANLLGAVVGAVLEPLSFLLGVKALLLVVAGLYVLAAASRPRVGDSGRA